MKKNLSGAYIYLIYNDGDVAKMPVMPAIYGDAGDAVKHGTKTWIKDICRLYGAVNAEVRRFGKVLLTTKK